MKVKIDRVNKFYNAVHIAKDKAYGVLSGRMLAIQDFERITGISVAKLTGMKNAEVDLELSRYNALLEGRLEEAFAPKPQKETDDGEAVKSSKPSKSKD